MIKERPGTKLVTVAAAVDVDQSTVCRWSTGESQIPDEKKRELAAFFGVSRAYLMGWDEEGVAA